MMTYTRYLIPIENSNLGLTWLSDFDDDLLEDDFDAISGGCSTTFD